MPEAFDTGPLSWVKDEIFQSLEKVLASFKHVTEEPSDFASLRFTEAHLYQISGALDMVGLEGCKRYCSEIEALTGKLEKAVIPVSNTVMTDIIAAIETLKLYIQDLLNGGRDTPLKLFDSLKPIMDAQNISLDESELFFPDTTMSAPKELPSTAIDETTLISFISAQRAVFQKALLEWLRLQDASALTAMQLALNEVLSVQQKSAHKTMCWTATALMDALLQPNIAQLNGAKKVCRKLDQYLRNMTVGDYKIPSHLLRDVLYFIAISEPTSPLLQSVKTHFSLDDLLPIASSQALVSPSAEQAIIAQLSAEIPSLKDTWSNINQGKLSEANHFATQLTNIGDIKGKLNNIAVTQLFANLQEYAHALQIDGARITDIALIEVAATLNALEVATESYQTLDQEAQQKLNVQSERLSALIAGEQLSEIADVQINSVQDASVVDAVAKQILEALQKAEKVFDIYFRKPANKVVLNEVSEPLQQVSAAFEMLEMATPAAIAALANDYAMAFKSATDVIPASQFELLAESLSMLSLYTEALPATRPEAIEALEDALVRMREGMLANTLASEANLNPANTFTENLADLASTDVTTKDTNIDKEVVDHATDSELLDIFVTEAEEVLATLAENIQALRLNLTDADALAEVRRAYHTLKGSGKTVGLVALGDVAWAIENLLNIVIENKSFANVKQLNFIEETTADFAGWIASLQAHATVNLNVKPYQTKAEELAKDTATATAQKVKEEVLIDGTHKLSRAFFNIFITEAEQHLAVLQSTVAQLTVDNKSLPTDASCRAAHTLGSNALTAGFKPMGDLARALEHWLDARVEGWSEADVTLYENVVNALQKAIEKAKQYKNVRTPRALINALAKSTEAMQKAVSDDAETARQVISDNTDLEETLSELETAVLATPEAIENTNTHAEPAISEPKVAVAELNTQTQTVDQELLGLFVEEARELVPQVGKDLRAWRNNPIDTDYSDSLQRALHTLKGSARMAGQGNIGDSVHAIEDLVIRALKRKVTLADFDEMFAEFDRVGYMLEDITGNNTISKAVAEPADKASPATRNADRKSQFLRLRADVLDRLINEAGEVSIMRSRMDREMQNFKQSSSDLTESISRLRAYLRELEIEAETQLQSRMSLLQEANELFDPLEFDRFTRLQELTRMMAESVNDVATIQQGLLLNLDQTDAALQQQNRMNRELQQGLMSVRMLPFATIIERLQRIVRQTARELDKRVELHITGETIEIDRGVLDKIGAPLEHLLRNAVAHGLESTEERLRLGKSEIGQIKLNISVENDEITLVITDDGAGVNMAKVKEKAIARGMFADAQAITDEALMAVIFEPGFSTADSVSQIAGRGVGLDAVRSDIASLGGRIDVSNAIGLGAMFNIYLPVTLSVAQVVMARVGQQVFAIPSVMVEQVQKLKPADLMNAYSANKVEWASRAYPLHYLAKLIGDTEHIAQQHDYTPVMLLRSGTYRSAVHVDEILGNLEVVMKQMGTQLSRVPGMIGATVLGDGAIVLVINPVQLANREALQVGAVKVSTVAPVVEKVKPLALVVDDSLTMRKVLSRLLEREGFDVVTANDGMDAVQKLQTSNPVIILTDIEMPRMDGFEFARHVRDNAATANTPLIVISSRTAEKHRNVATELGVNAFLGKPVQDEELISQVNALLPAH